MNIKELKDRSAKLEGELKHLIRKFERETGVVVKTINLDRIDIVGRLCEELTAVEVKLDLW
jgi:hypothetical protein